MKASDAHSLLLTCQAPQNALIDFGEAVAKGRVPGTATVVYQDTGHEGDNAKIKPYWRRIVNGAQEAAVWTEGRADLSQRGDRPAVWLTEIEFDDEAVAEFVKERTPSRPKRGKRRIEDHWTPFWIAAVQLAKTGRLTVGHFPTQKALYERLHVMMGATLDEQTIKPLSAILYQNVAQPTLDELEEIVAETD